MATYGCPTRPRRGSSTACASQPQRLLDAPERSIAVLGGASEGLGQIAAALAAGLTADAPEVLLVSTDFPSVTYPWLAASRRTTSAAAPVLRWVEDEPGGDLTEQIISAITERTGVVCVSAVQYSTGTMVDMRAVTAAAHAVGARVVADVTQLAGAAPVSMRRWGVDALVCSEQVAVRPWGRGTRRLQRRDELVVPPLVGWMGAEDPFDFSATDPSDWPMAPFATALHHLLHLRRRLQHSLDLLTGTGREVLASHSRDLAHELVDLWSLLGGVHSDHCTTQQQPSHRLVASSARSAPRCRPPWPRAPCFTASRNGGIRVSLHGFDAGGDLRLLPRHSSLSLVEPLRRSLVSLCISRDLGIELYSRTEISRAADGVPVAGRGRSRTTVCQGGTRDSPRPARRQYSEPGS